MSKNSYKPVSLAVTAVLVGGMGLSASAFAMTDLAQGYLLGAGDAVKSAEGTCGEGKCGMAAMDADKDGRVSKAEFAAAHGGDGSAFAAHDPDNDGFMSAAELKAHHEGACGAAAMSSEKSSMEGKCGADAMGAGKAGAEGSCGADTPKPKAEKAGMEGKCGEGKCGGAA